MTIYNSQWVNNDPLPWKSDTGARYPEAVYSKSLERASFEPRPEYANNPNEILVAFRAAGGDKSPRGGVGAKAARVLRIELVWDLDYREPEMKDHALKVLEKLVRVYGEQGDNK